MVRFGIENTITPLRRALLHSPVESLGAADALAWGYPAGRDRARALAEHAGLCALLAAEGVEITVDDQETGVDATYACDPAVMTPWGAVICAMGKPERRDEAPAMEARLRAAGVDVLGAITAPGTLEGGDAIWLDRATLWLGIGARTNHAAADQLAALLAPRGVQLRRVELPWRDGPGRCLHLRSLINVIDVDLAVIDRPWLPFVVLSELADRGLRLIDAVPEEIDTQGNNILVLRPRVVALVCGNPRTEALLATEGVEVRRFEGDELCVKGTGGPSCLVLDLHRG